MSQSFIISPSVFATFPCLLSTSTPFTSLGLVVWSDGDDDDDDDDDDTADDATDSKFSSSSAISFYH